MEEWKECKLKDIVEINPTESLKKGTVAKKIGMDVLQAYCRAIPSFSFEPYTGGTKIKNGDTIMARITPCLENGKTAMVNILDDNEIGFGSTKYIVFRAKNNITYPYFIYYLVTSDCIRNPAIKSMVGSSGRQRVQTDVVANLSINLPPLPTQQKIAAQDYILTPGRYVGIEEKEEDDEPFADKMNRLTTELGGMFAKSHELEEEIKKNLVGIGFKI